MPRFNPNHFCGVVTSGEVTHRHLTQRPDAWWAGLGRRCLHFTWAARGAISLEGLGLEVTTDPQQARACCTGLAGSSPVEAGCLSYGHVDPQLLLPLGLLASGHHSHVHHINLSLAAPQADFILAHGTEALGTSTDGSAAQPASLDAMRELLDACAARGGLPMVVANPDVVTVSGTELRCGSHCAT